MLLVFHCHLAGRFDLVPWWLNPKGRGSALERPECGTRPSIVSRPESRIAVLANPRLSVRGYHDCDGAAGIPENALNLRSKIDALVD